MPRDRVQRESDKAAAEHPDESTGTEQDGRPDDDKATRKAAEAEHQARVEQGVPVNPPEPESENADLLLPEVDGRPAGAVNPPEPEADEDREG
jgi:hypothetical protein